MSRSSRTGLALGRNCNVRASTWSSTAVKYNNSAGLLSVSSPRFLSAVATLLGLRLRALSSSHAWYIDMKYGWSTTVKYQLMSLKNKDKSISVTWRDGRHATQLSYLVRSPVDRGRRLPKFTCCDAALADLWGSGPCGLVLFCDSSCRVSSASLTSLNEA